MRYQALACDYDGTLASDGRVSEATLAALERLVASGRKLILVTGRLRVDLERVFPHLELFERVVVENGATIFHPAKHEERRLAEPPPPAFAEELRRRGVTDLSQGEVIVATWTPHEVTVLETIRDQGLDLQVIFNKGAVMILPSGINKRTGLDAALVELGLSAHNAVGVGDAENDHPFLEACECSCAVANALAVVKAKCDIVTRADHGAGVVELIDRILATDLSDVARARERHQILLGERVPDGAPAIVDAHGPNILVAGPSGSGKSTTSTAIIERLIDKGYQLCLIDPEGDYESFEGTVCLGTPEHAPSVDEVAQLLAHPHENAVVTLLGLPLTERPSFFAELFPRLQDLRARTGRPHWIVIDEAHHLLPASWEPAPLALPQRLGETLLITVHPDRVAPAILAAVDTVVAVGANPDETLRGFARVLGIRAPEVDRAPLDQGEVLVWERAKERPIARVKVTPARAERMRHRRKYAEGELGDHSFYFRGPSAKLNLRAQNLMLFAQIADGVDDETWLFHLRQGDYTGWFRDKIKDPELADEARLVATDERLSAAESRQRIRLAIERRYSLPA
jgi:hydroxymethylpyrimidine pyrophosphatase-like HAD family hydrolase